MRSTIYQMTMQHAHNAYTGQTGQGVRKRGQQHVQKSTRRRPRNKLYRYLHGRVHRAIWTPLVMFRNRAVRVYERIRQDGRIIWERGSSLNTAGMEAIHDLRSAAGTVVFGRRKKFRLVSRLVKTERRRRGEELFGGETKKAESRLFESPGYLVTCPDFQATVGNGPSPFSFRNSLEHCVGDFNQQGRFETAGRIPLASAYVLGTSSGVFGASWGPLGGSLGPLLGVLGASWRPLGGSLRSLGGFLGCLGGLLGALRGAFGTSWAVFGASWALFGKLWRHFGGLGSLLGGIWMPNRAQKGSQSKPNE